MIDGVLRWFGHLERMENDRISKRVYVYVVQYVIEDSDGIKVYCLNNIKNNCAMLHMFLYEVLKCWLIIMMSGKQEERCRIGVNGRGL